MSGLPEPTDEDREFLARVLSGAHDDDMIRRGDVYQIIRELRRGDASLKSPLIYQRALSDVQRKVARL